ncbi:MAG TPA: SgcJ/EcaC family oxidoreductase [Stellaceae bacterium]
MKLALALAAALFALAASPSVAQTAAGEIEKANEQLAQALNAGDAAKAAGMYTERAVVLPPEAEMIEGREAIRKYWQDALDAGIKNLSLTSVRVDEYGGDAAREIGRFSFDAPAAQGKTSRVDGKYVVVWRKSGGEWRLDTDIWNMTEPPDSGLAATDASAFPPATSGSGSPPPSR